MVDAVIRSSAETRMAEARWDGNPACPACGSVRCGPGGAGRSEWRGWRCRDCRKRFTVTTGTSLHSTKLRPGEWIAVVEIDEPTAAAVAAVIGVSHVTARKVAGLLRPIRGEHPDVRLRRLLRSRPARTPTVDRWLVDPLPATVARQGNPLVGLSDGTKATLNALRARPFGATARKLANLSGVSYAQTLRCLARLERLGWARTEAAMIPCGYESKRVRLWSLSWSPRCMHALGCLRFVPPQSREHPAEQVPPRFWRCFWSGASAEALRVSKHGLYIAETLIGGRDPCARAWAISNLPTDVLRQCRALRGCDTGLFAELIDSEIRRRADERR